MTNITFENGILIFQTHEGVDIDSPLELAEVVDEFTYHLGTNVGVFLLNVNAYSINQITFTTSIDAVNYLSQ